MDDEARGGNRNAHRTRKLTRYNRVGIVMSASSIPQTEEQLLKGLQTTDDPTGLLSDLFDSANHEDDVRLRRLLRNLSALGCINIPMWANNKPYYVELLESDIPLERQPATININDNHSINIGNGAKISHSFLQVDQETKSVQSRTGHQSLFEKHPVICSLLISFIVGFALLFSFWKDIVNAIEGLF